MFSSRLSLPALIELCRVLRHYLASGLTLTDVFAQQAKRGSASVRPVASRISDVLETGGSLESALKRETAVFPPLFISLGSVGEKTGMLPEIFGDLESYFQHQLKLKRAFLARITWPCIQFVMAVGVVSLVIIILGMLAPSGQKPFDPLGLGLFGVSGAVIFAGTIFGIVGGTLALLLFMKKSLGGKSSLERILLNVPALGPCLTALAMGRFCLALRLTTEAGISIKKALRMSLKATGNNAFVAVTTLAEDSVAVGDDLTLALERTGVFPDDFLRIISVAEEAGTLTDVLRHQGDHYYDEATRRMAVLTSVAGYGIWAMIGVFIVILIFRMYSSYLNLLGSFGA